MSKKYIIKCPVCGKRNNCNYIRNYFAYKMTYKMFLCNYCNVQFWTPFINPGKKWYEEYDLYTRRDLYGLKLTYINKYFLNLLKNFKKKRLNILDIGCGVGNLVSAVNELGHNGWGIDFDRKAIQTGKKLYKLQHIYADSIERFSKKKDIPKFDILVCFEVLEHVDHINPLLKMAKLLSAKNGCLFISIPNRNRATTKNVTGDFPPHHLTRWDENSVKNTLKRYFKTVEVEFLEKNFVNFSIELTAEGSFLDFVRMNGLKRWGKEYIKSVYESAATSDKKQRSMVILEALRTVTLIKDLSVSLPFSIPLRIYAELFPKKKSTLFIKVKI